MITTIIVEDDPKHSARLKNLLQKTFPDICNKAVCSNVNDAIDALTLHKPQLIFLDIELGNETAFDLLNKTNIIDFDIIFTTNYINKYILDIRACALTYLAKPIDITELEEAVGKFVEKKYPEHKKQQIYTLRNNINTDNIATKCIWVNDPKGNYVPIEIANIIYCSSENQYTYFYIYETNKEKITTLASLGLKPDKNGMVTWVSSKGIGEWEDILEYYGLFRVHNRNIINPVHVKKYSKADGDTLYMSCETIIPMSRERKKKFLTHIGLK